VSGNGETPEQGEAIVDGESREETGVELAADQPVRAEDPAALQHERDELRDQLLRRRAEFENYKRRVERDRHLAGFDAVADLLKAMIPTLDHLELALQAPSADAALRDGLELIRRGLLGTLEGRGLATEDPQGARFDPERHQAVSFEESDAVPEGSVLRVLGKGYALKERLLRPALVVVARGPGEASDAGTNARDGVH
jgi:molecular chaperone GrpE